jgi:hypothetical protein
MIHKVKGITFQSTDCYAAQVGESILGSPVSNQAELVHWVQCSRSGTYALTSHFEVNKRCSESDVN